MGHFPRTLRKYGEAAKFVVERVNRKDVAELERLGTALYVTINGGEESDEQRADRIHTLKPHVSKERAFNATRWTREAIEDAKSLGLLN